MKLNLWITLCLATLLMVPLAIIGCGGDDDDSAGDDDTADDDDTSVGDDDTSVGDDDSSAGDDDSSAGDDDSSAGDDDSSGDDDSAAAADPSCADYCASRQANCSGETGELDEATCNLACGAAVAGGLPLGTTGDTGGNTLGCRQYHTGVAGQTSDAAHCGHGNLIGGSTATAFLCASDQEAYCALQLANCGANGDAFANYGECWTALTGASLAAGTLGETSGNTLACRLYHLEVAPADAALHCPHGSIAGTGGCE